MLSDRQPDAVSKQGPRCGVERLFEVLPPAEIEALNGMFADRRWTDPAIYDACKDEKYVVPRFALIHHRRKRCRCFMTCDEECRVAWQHTVPCRHQAESQSRP